MQREGESTGEYETFIKHSPTIRPHLNLREKPVQLKSPRALRIPPALSPYASKLLPSKKPPSIRQIIALATFPHIFSG